AGPSERTRACGQVLPSSVLRRTVIFSRLVLAGFEKMIPPFSPGARKMLAWQTGSTRTASSAGFENVSPPSGLTATSPPVSPSKLRVSSITAPPATSPPWPSLPLGPTTPPSFHDLPASSLKITCDCRTLPPSALWSHGTRSRPDFSWMPTPGPVAYHVHSGFLTSFVISTGLSQVAPSSVLFVTHTVREPLLVPPTIFSS